MKLEVPIEFPEPKAIYVVSDRKEAPSAGFSSEPAGAGPSSVPASPLLSLATLPPILLDVLLPATYPYSPPIIQSLHATHSWLPLDRKLQRMLLETWQDGEGVLYSWIETIRSGEFLDSLDMLCDMKGQEAIRYVMFPPSERKGWLTSIQDTSPGAPRTAACAQGVRPVYPADKILTGVL